jgi:hypothetical protein
MGISLDFVDFYNRGTRISESINIKKRQALQFYTTLFEDTSSEDPSRGLLLKARWSTVILAINEHPPEGGGQVPSTQECVGFGDVNAC